MEMEIRKTYDIRCDALRPMIKALRKLCDTCALHQTLPTSTPASYIVSNCFGERLLVDCKTVFGKGYFVVAVDHFTTYTWTKFVERKFGEPIAVFVSAVIIEVRQIRQNRPHPDDRTTAAESTDPKLHVSNREVCIARISRPQIDRTARIEIGPCLEDVDQNVLAGHRPIVVFSRK